MLEFLTDQSFISAMATIIGPLAFFAAPTEEIEDLLMADAGLKSAQMVVVLTNGPSVDVGVAEAA